MGDYAPKYLPGHDVTYTAASAITGGQVVYLSAAGTCAITSGALTAVLGVASRDVATGEELAVCRGGVQRCVSGAAIAVGDPVISAATGRVVPFGAGTNYNQVLGTALTAAGGAGITVDVQWEK